MICIHDIDTSPCHYFEYSIFCVLFLDAVQVILLRFVSQAFTYVFPALARCAVWSRAGCCCARRCRGSGNRRCGSWSAIQRGQSAWSGSQQIRRCRERRANTRGNRRHSFQSHRTDVHQRLCRIQATEVSENVGQSSRDIDADRTASSRSRSASRG